MKIIAGANAWRKVEGVMGFRRILRKRNGNVFSSCITPGIHECTRDDGTDDGTGEGPRFAKNNMIRIIVGLGVKKADKRKWMK